MSKNLSSILKTNKILGFGAGVGTGDDYTICGAGSTIAAAKWVMKELPLLVERYGIKSIVDLPCGDFNWMRKVKFGTDVSYIGADYNEKLIDVNKTKYPGLDFRVINALSDPIPTADLVFCRDLLPHLPFEESKAVLANIKASGSKYILTTTFSWRMFQPVDIVRDDDSNLAPWTRLNLFMEPFNMPPCLDFIVEFNQEQDNPTNLEKNIGFGDKVLALWECSSL